jgi:hypothetical protein
LSNSNRLPTSILYTKFKKYKIRLKHNKRRWTTRRVCGKRFLAKSRAYGKQFKIYRRLLSNCNNKCFQSLLKSLPKSFLRNLLRNLDNLARTNHYNLGHTRSIKAFSLQVKRSLDICQIVNHSSILNASLFSLRIPRFTNISVAAVAKTLPLLLRNRLPLQARSPQARTRRVQRVVRLA